VAEGVAEAVRSVDRVARVDVVRLLADAEDLGHARRDLRVRAAVGREAHQLAFLAVRLEAAELGERRVELAERVREADLLEAPDVEPLAVPDRRRLGLAAAVDDDDRGLLEARREEPARCVRAVVRDERDRRNAPGNPAETDVLADQLLEERRRE